MESEYSNEILTRQRKNGPGYRKSTEEMTYDFDEVQSAVYEIAISVHDGARVVYVGQTKDFLQRLRSYCSNGSHLQEEIDDALDDGCDIFVRALPLDDSWDARRIEKVILNNFIYDWNEQ